MKCAVCGAKFRNFLNHVIDPESCETFSILRCSKCEIKHTVPHPDDVTRYYNADYHGGRHGILARIRAIQRFKLVRKLQNDKRRQNILDIGCGDGLFLKTAKEYGWDVAGTELFPDRHDYVDLNVVQSIDDIKQPTLFDVITLWHSLEHLDDPEREIKKIKAILNPGGFLVISVPNSDGWQARIFGNHWLHYDVPRHIWHFNLRSLDFILSKCGFQVCHQEHQEFEYDVMGWVQSLLDVIMPRKRILLNFLMNKLKNEEVSSIVLNIVCGFVCFPFSCIAVAAGRLSGKNGTIVVSSRLKNDH